MDFNPAFLSTWGTKLCVVQGILSSPGQDDGAAGELQLWYNARYNKYCINTIGTWRLNGWLVCELLMFLLFHFQECLNKIKTLLTRSPGAQE